MVGKPAPSGRPDVPFELLNSPAPDRDAWNAAWDALITAYSPMLKRYVTGIAEGVDGDDVDDIVQMTWDRVQRNLSDLRDVDVFERWARRLAKTCWLEHLRRKKPAVHVYDSDDFVLDDYRDPHAPVDAVLGRVDIYEQVYRRLDPASQVYLEEKVVEGLSHAELANRRNISEVGSKKKWNRLRKQIESILRDLGVDGYDAA